MLEVMKKQPNLRGNVSNVDILILIEIGTYIFTLIPLKSKQNLPYIINISKSTSDNN